MEVLEAEALVRVEKLSKPISLRGPAVTNLLITPIRGKPLPAYSSCADFISSQHCRLCLADCRGLQPLRSYPDPNAMSELPAVAQGNEPPVAVPRCADDTAGCSQRCMDGYVNFSWSFFSVMRISFLLGKLSYVQGG